MSGYQSIQDIQAALDAAEAAAKTLQDPDRGFAENRINVLKLKLKTANLQTILDDYAAKAEDLPTPQEVDAKIAAAKDAQARQQDRVAAVNWVIDTLGRLVAFAV